MYCIKCGSQLENNANYCPSCGAPQTKEKQKESFFVIKEVRFIPFLICGVIVSILFGIIKSVIVGNTTTTPDNTEQKVNTTTTITNDENVLNPELYEYEGYVTIDNDSAPYDDIERYLPNEGTYYGTLFPGNSKPNAIGQDITEIEYVTDTAILFKNYLGDAIVSYGNYQVSVNVNGKKYCKKVNKSTSNTSYEFLEPDTQYELANNKIIGVPPYAYTVTVPAGTFNNCICMITWENIQKTNVETDWGYGECITLDYYAPSVGKVFSFEMGDFVKNTFTSYGKDGTYATYELVRIESSLENTSMTTSESNINTYSESETESNSGIYPEGETESNTIELTNGLIITLPDNWIGKYIVTEGAMYYSFYEQSTWESDSSARGHLFSVCYISSCEELNYYPQSKLLGVYKDNGEWFGLIIEYPSDIDWDENNEETANNYFNLTDTIDDIIFDTSNLDDFVECTENSLSDYLPQSIY